MNSKLIEKNHLKEEDFEPKADETQATLEKVEAQTLYTALMTDTMLEDEESEE